MEGYSLRLNGPYAYNVASEGSWVDRRAPSEYALEIGGAELLQGLNPADWQNATALTSQTARAALDADKALYYGTSINNIASRRAAQSAGFYPLWVSAFTTAK